MGQATVRIRKPKSSTLRQRLRPQETERQSVARTFSYRSQRSEQTSNTGRTFRAQVLNPAERFSGFWLQRFGLGILVIVGSVCLITTLGVSPNVKLQQIGPNAESSLFHNQSAYQGAANRLIAGSLTNHNKITINTTKLASELLKAYPELASVTFTMPLVSHRPILYISYTKPALILHNQSGSFVLDTNGKVLVPTGKEAINLGLPSVADYSGLQMSLNRQVLTSGNVQFIRVIATGLQSKHISISRMSLPASASELDVAITGSPYYVKYNLQAQNPLEQLGSFLAVQKHLAGQSIQPSQYIDVRVEGRAYYQ